ncbi:MAG: MobC family plasmid mobilization relaxosome protein [Clostridiales bacterium]|nr:MobC family plasmid mobilization relaxosome protein [Clostridiales bacterium]
MSASTPSVGFAAITEKMNKLGMSNLSEFIRFCTTVNQIIQVDIHQFNELIYELNKIGINLNQIAKAANTSKNIYQSDVEEVKRQLAKLNKLIKILGKSLREFR